MDLANSTLNFNLNLPLVETHLNTGVPNDDV